MTPSSGAFSFISKLRSGSTGDHRITQESGLLALLEEGMTELRVVRLPDAANEISQLR